MKKALITLVLAAAAALLAYGCEPGSSDSSNLQQCPGGCPFGQVCQGGLCINQGGGQDNPTQPSQPTGPQCSNPMQACGTRCVDLQSDRLNCGGCGNACGASSDCVFGQCTCVGTAKDCNGQRIDGCECQACDTADPSKCKTAPACDPTQAGSCSGTGMYCTNTVTGTLSCQTCPAGYSNCDGVGNCECSGSCNGNQCQSGNGGCDPSTTNSCGSNGAFCDTSSKACANCQAGYTNCDGQWGCECQGTCSGSQCIPSGGQNPGTPPPGNTGQCNTNQRNSCGDSQFYCDPATSTCQNCDTWFSSKRNCDGVGGCETSGTTCTNTVQCNPSQYMACGSVLWYCDPGTGTCQNCQNGTSNCDGTGVCETYGSCTGQGSIPPSGYCSDTTPFQCGGDQNYCDATTRSCRQCPYGYRNCNGVYTCEASGSCGSSSGGGNVGQTCSDAVAWTCGGDNYFCNKNTGRCEQCAYGTRNCNGLQICELSGTTCSGSSGGGTTGTGNYDIIAYSVQVSSKNSSGSDWDTLPWTSPPDPYIALKVGSSGWKSSNDQSDTTSATFNETLITNVNVTGQTLQIEVRDWDNVTYETMGSCSVYLSSSTLASGSAVVTYCGGSSVTRVEVRFRRR
ncbi:MAG: hypothetical protein KC503_42295 [Myxococcales bacterium]|nr:hypothetical protein [Myxococcales bacterium]